jgi:hypothetical protein
MITPGLALDLALSDFGETALIGGTRINVLLTRADVVADPYTSDMVSDAPSPWLALAQKNDLADANLWPLPVDEITIDDAAFRVLRSQARGGEVEIYLREV